MKHELLAKLIKQAQGARSQNEFALHSGVSSAAITKIRQGKRRPSPDILRKLASRAYNDVTYEALMVAAGYISSTQSYVIPSPAIPSPTLTEKDIAEVKRKVEKVKELLLAESSLAFGGEIEDEETLDKVLAVFESGLMLAKEESKGKYTPKTSKKKD